jgi:DNA-binding CsgD family transcriptional regulator
VFEAIGLDPTAEAVYRLVLSRPDLEVEQLAEQLELPADDVRRAISSLQELRLLRKEGSGKDLELVDPDVGLAALLARSEAELSARQRQIEATRSAVNSIAAQYNGRHERALEGVRLISGLDSVRARLEELAPTIETEIMSFVPDGAQRPDIMEASKPLDQQALERGVQMRDIYQESFRNDPATLQYVGWVASLGGQTRTVPSLPMRLLIIDRKIALVPLDPSDAREGAMELSGPGLVATMCVLFEQFWTAATPWTEPPPQDKFGLTRREREILTMLAIGHTDDWIARRLGLSLRTVRRVIADLMGRLDARSRFEAGVLAVRSGWL